MDEISPPAKSPSCVVAPADPTGNPWTSFPLHAACRDNNVPQVLLLLDEGIDHDQRISDDHPFRGTTPLFVAAVLGHTETLRCLLKHGAGANLADREGWTPCIAAAHADDLPTLRCLIEYAADINLADRDGQTPLYVAAHAGHVPTLRCLLVENGADMNLATNSGFTSVHIAAAAGQLRALACLLKNGANATCTAEVSAAGAANRACTRGHGLGLAL